MVQKVECNPDAKTATLTYYKNLATTEAEGEKSPTGESGAGGDTTPTTCPTGTSTEGAGGYATTLADNSMCYCETAGSVYKDSTCETKEDNTCSSYADCDKGEYCQFNPSVFPPRAAPVRKSRLRTPNYKKVKAIPNLIS